MDRFHRAEMVMDRCPRSVDGCHTSLRRRMMIETTGTRTLTRTRAPLITMITHRWWSWTMTFSPYPDDDYFTGYRIEKNAMELRYDIWPKLSKPKGTMSGNCHHVNFWATPEIHWFNILWGIPHFQTYKHHAELVIHPRNIPSIRMPIDVPIDG